MSDCTISMLDLGRKAGGCEPVALSLGQIKIAVECILEPLSKIYEKKKKKTLKATH